LAYFLLLIALFFLCGRFRLEKILAPISGGIALIVFAYGLAQKFVLFPLILAQTGLERSPYLETLRARVASGRIFAIFSLPTLYAMVCGLLLIFIIHYLYHARGLIRLFWALLLALGGVNLVLTQSFGGILFFMAGILFYLFASRIFKARYLAPLLMVLALVFFLVTALRFSEAREMAPARLRVVNWLQAGRVLASAPVLGVGLGNYETTVTAHLRPGEPESIYAHNFFLQFAAETGLPLFILLLVSLFPLVRKGIASLSRPENSLFAAAGILILLFNLFDVGNFFFASGVSFSVVFSQLVPGPGKARPRVFILAALPALLLLANETAAGRQKSGDLWLGRQDLARASAQYRGALEVNPFAYRAWLGLAHIAWLQNDLPRAEKALERVLRIYPQQPYANYMLSLAAQRRGAYLTALVHARRASVADRKNKEYQRWHDIIQKNFADQPALSGN
jgi:tetratricopeptide (TPR) repeat protein